MKLLALFSALALSFQAGASLLKETRSSNVDESSIHLNCFLEDASLAKFASYSRITIKTDFGDDSPTANAYGASGRLAETAALANTTDHEALNMRIFEIQDYEANTLVNLVVVFSKKNGKIEARAVLTSNGQQNPVVNPADMKCEYMGPMAINN